MDDRNTGFTMIEVLLVLSILSLFIYLGGVGVQKLWSTMERKVFISQLEADLYYAQTFAISRKTNVSVDFYPLYDRYVAKNANENEILFDRQLSKSIDLLNAGAIRSFSITGDGSITKFGTLSFRNQQNVISLVFYIGMGRFRIEQ